MENQDTHSGKTSGEHCPPHEERTSAESLKNCAGSKMMPLMCLDLRNGSQQDLFGGTDTQWHGGVSMLSTGESPRDASVSTLSQILMGTAPERYYLTPRACQGILRRCRQRGKILPEPLKTALERQAQETQPTGEKS